MRKTVAEYFAGIGLMRLGLEQANWEISFANDISLKKKHFYELNFGVSNHFVLEDVHNLEVENIPPTFLATASFPCTDLSLAGGREGIISGKESSAVWAFIKIIEESTIRPNTLLIENVPGLISSNNGNDLRQLIETLTGLGYWVDMIQINAANFVPQSRKRIFLIAHVNNLPLGSLTSPSELEITTTRPKQIVEFIKSNLDLNWMLYNLPELPAPALHLAFILEDVPNNDSQWWNASRTNYLLSQMNEAHKHWIDTNVASEIHLYATAFRRRRNGKSMAEIRTDDIAGCLRTPKGGSAKQILVKVGQGEVKVRLLSPRECARLMGADNFVLPANANEAYFGFGDGVCVPVINWIANNYLNRLYEFYYLLNRRNARVPQPV